MTTKLTEQAVNELGGMLRGSVLMPGEAEYDEARTIWNAMIDRKPAVIVRAMGESDIIHAVKFAREQSLNIAIKGGGHNVAGNAVCDAGLMLDLSLMKGIWIDPANQRALVQPGALLSDLDTECQAHGLATPAGFISSTGVAGLTLGGGFGYLSRKHGLTVDNLCSADVITAEGKRVHASENQNADLFWGLKGGGGNFGLVSCFEFQLHELGPEVVAGPVIHSFDDAPSVLSRVGQAMESMPDTVSCLSILRFAPPAPFIPEAYHGQLILLLAIIHSGNPAEGEKVLAPLREIGNPVADKVMLRPYCGFQSMFDKTANHGARNYWKAHYLNKLEDDAVKIMCDHAATMTSKESVIGMLSLGGEVSRRAPESAPYPHRKANWVLNVQSRWRKPQEDEEHIAWARGLFDAISPHATGGAYVNFISQDEGPDRIKSAYDQKIYQRLAELKAKWDPENFFHYNQNIAPQSG